MRGEALISRFNVAADRRGWHVLALAAVAFAFLLDVLIRHDPISVDFHTYLAAGKVGLDHGWSSVYNQWLVAVAQKELSPGQIAQPFLSPPTVAFVTAPLVTLPYGLAYVVWAVFILAMFAVALAWAGVSTGWGRWIAVVGALAPWWVMHAVNVGQVVPLVAAGTVVAWRLTRERRDVLAGIALVTLVLKPNTAILVPIALLFAWRYRAFAAWVGASAAVLIVVLLTVGPDGMWAYVTQLRGPLPKGADDLTLHGALSLTGVFATALRVLIIGAVLAASYKLRHSPGLVIPLAIVGSLVVSPYLHGSDLVLLAAAGWMVWEERPALAWRAPLALGWFLASPYLYLKGASLHLNRWPWLEIALLLALVIAAWWPLTTWDDSRRQAPA
ncbi:MAG: DUF2029 domain-containing protein [Chloroflexi bacterium]|nr:MAG: DUF2029 domain-containing protein [Chloroflexota bacterium]TMG43987.1 MAG: DUF2029 domain-containing protein [Chloroflexota bacterium]